MHIIRKRRKIPLDKRGIRRMLVTTLGRIERLEDWLSWPDLPEIEKPALREQIAQQQAKLRQYNEMASALLAKEAK